MIVAATKAAILIQLRAFEPVLPKTRAAELPAGSDALLVHAALAGSLAVVMPRVLLAIKSVRRGLSFQHFLHVVS